MKLPLQQSDKGMVKSRKRVIIKWSIPCPSCKNEKGMGEEYEEG